MRSARAAAWLAVAAWHCALVVSLWAGQHGGAAPAAPTLAVRVLPVRAPERSAATVAAQLPFTPPRQDLSALALVAPPAFDIEAEPPRPDLAGAPVTTPSPAPGPQLPAPAPAEPVLAVEAPPLQPARRAACAPTPHPQPLRERGIEGVVRLRVWVDELGRAGQVLLAGSSGWRLFDDAAMAQARRCPFHPAQRGSQPVGSWVEFPVRFALETSNG